MATHYIATRGIPYECAHQCAGCCAYSMGVAYGKGRGGASTGILDHDEARERAEFAASGKAARDAEAIADLAPCPRCKKRNASAITRLLIVTSTPWVVLAGAGVWAAVTYDPERTGSPLPIVVVVAALLASIVVTIRGIGRWMGSTSRVELSVVPAPDE